MENQTKKVLGLDIGTNSIGGALLSLPKEFDDFGNGGNIEWLGSRIIPVDGDYLQKFESGAQGLTKAANRRQKRGSRRLKHRYKLRRTRLIKVLKALGWINEDFPLDDSRNFKQGIKENGYSLKISDYLPFSTETMSEFEKEFRFAEKKSRNGKIIVTQDWIVYFLRKKALTKQITIPELVRIIYMFNQRRGFKSSRKDLNTTNVLPYGDFKERQRNGDFGEGIETQFVSITKIKSVKFKEEKKDKRNNISNVYTIEAEDPRMDPWEEVRKKEPEWVGKEFTFLVTQKFDKNGNYKSLKPQMPNESDWALCTTALSEKIQENDQYPGEFFYEQIRDAYLTKRNFKARQFPVHRWRYEKELEAIWKKQCELNTELAKVNSDKETLTKLAYLLYPFQAKHKMPKLTEFQNNDLLYIISKDIIYYQRELRSQKNSISECRYEKRKGIDGEVYGLKCIPRSSPLFQEFRIWQDIHNIRLLKKEEMVNGKTKIDTDVTSTYVDDSIKEELFELFQIKTSISEKDILELIKERKVENDIKIDNSGEESSHRINLFANRVSLKGNETLARYRNLFRKADFDGENILTDNEKLLKLWHIDYSITSSDEKKSEKGFVSALANNQNRRKKEKKVCFNLPKEVIDLFLKLPELKKEYGAYSACAIKKLLPVMRCGKYWNKNEVTETLVNRSYQIKERLNSIDNDIKRLNEEADDDVQKQVLKSFIKKEDLTKGLNTYQAGYLIYGQHSERKIIHIKTADEFSKYIQKEIPNNSLRNPIVEQVVKETMFLVRDVWKKYGEIDEIHIELGRNLKNNSVQRKKISDTQKGNFEEKRKIQKLLYELMNDGFEQYIDDDVKENATFEVYPNPESPADINKFRIWRSLSKKSDLEWIKIVREEKIPTKQEIKKYTLWISQNCRSPYTGKIIPLSKLFDKNQYEIEHIIPRAKMKNDSFNNLVISEAAINPNPYKGHMLARNFITQFGGTKGKQYEINGKKYFILSENQYESLCKDTFKYQKAKLKNLLATEVPDDFVERQLNDTRYIGRKLSELLAPVAKCDNGIIFSGGTITSELKNNWGLHNVWKEIIKPRFERFEKITSNSYIVKDKDEYGNSIFHFNVKENPDINTKRIDHRHHALDAIIIAATTREHIRYLNTLHAADTDEEIMKIKQSLVKGKIRDFKQPWFNFTKDVKDAIEGVIVSFKTNNKIVTKPQNRTSYYKLVNGKPIKEFKPQKTNPRWMAVRKSMFKEPQGVIYLKEIYDEKNVSKAVEIQINRMLHENQSKIKRTPYIYDKGARQVIKEIIEKTGIPIQDKDLLMNEINKYLKKTPLTDLLGNEKKTIQIATFEEYAAKRVVLDKTFDHKKIDKIPYAKNGKSVLGKILHEHLDSDEFRDEKGNSDPAKAFNREGLELLEKKAGRPITKVTIYEKKDESSKFGNRYVEVDAGSNTYFVMYENQRTRERTDFHSVPTHKAIEKIVMGEPIAEDKKGFDKIILSPGDLVYVPTIAQIEKKDEINWTNKKEISERIYQVRKFSKKQCYFLKSTVSDLISSYDSNSKLGEYGSQNLVEKNDDDLKIIDVCIKLKVDRLGNIEIAKV